MKSFKQWLWLLNPKDDDDPEIVQLKLGQKETLELLEVTNLEEQALVSLLFEAFRYRLDE